MGASSSKNKIHKVSIKQKIEYPIDSEPHYTEMMKKIHDSLIGEGLKFNGPFGERRVLYLDYTASGRAISFVEDFIKETVCKTYANTHTLSCITARQTSQYREDSRSYIKSCVNANEDDVLVFTGSGVTGAIHKLIGALQFQSDNTVCLHGPYEHHSNILPWKESGAQVLEVKETSAGRVDLVDLEEKLKNSAGKLIIGTFSAASNVTGIITDVSKVTTLLKKYGALSFWDYATGGPYLEINMNRSSKENIDAVFISPHKFIGGPQTPGILIAKRNLFNNKVPVIPGGGTVSYVYSGGHEYLNDIESREEGGTPAIIESIRATLAFKIKEAVQTGHIESREKYLYLKAKHFWSECCPNLVLLGSGSVKRLPIFSFIVKHPTSHKLIHHNFISTLLNDLYGMQTRGGCACAGPYGEKLLGIDASQFLTYFKRDRLLTSLSCNCGLDTDHSNLDVLKPGFCRLNLPYTITSEELQFVLKAVEDVSKNGWKLLPQYKFDVHTGAWTHCKPGVSRLIGLADIHVSLNGIKIQTGTTAVGDLTQAYFEDTLDHTKKIYNEAEKDCLHMNQSYLPDNVQQDIVWFLTPEEATDLMHGGPMDLPIFINGFTDDQIGNDRHRHLPFQPRRMSIRPQRRKVKKRG